MCTVHESKKKKLFYSSHQLKNHFFLSLTPCLCLSPKSLSSHSLSQITLSPCLSFSPKSLILSQITHHQALILSTQPSQGPKSLIVAPLSPSRSLSLSTLTPLLTGFDCEIELTGFDCFVFMLRWVFVVVLRWVFVVVRSDLWAGGATVLWFVVGWRPLWIHGGHSVGLCRWGYGAGIMEVWLWVWDCGGGLCCGFASDKREEESREKEKNK